MAGVSPWAKTVPGPRLSKRFGSSCKAASSSLGFPHPSAIMASRLARTVVGEFNPYSGPVGAIEPDADSIQALLNCVPSFSHKPFLPSPHNSAPSATNPMSLSEIPRRQHSRSLTRFLVTAFRQRSPFSPPVLVSQSPPSAMSSTCSMKRQSSQSHS